MIRTKTRKPKATMETSLKLVSSSDTLVCTGLDGTTIFSNELDTSRSESDDFVNNFDDIMFDAKEDLSDHEHTDSNRKSMMP